MVVAKPELKAVPKQSPRLHAPKRLDIACGQNKTPGFKGIDVAGDADIRHDLFSYPWPIKSLSVEEVTCNHFVEHIPHYLPQWPGVDGWFMFFNEVDRICKKGAELRFTHPQVKNERAFWDPTHVRFIHWMNYSYLNKEWRISQGLDHYPVSTNFEVVTVDGGLADSLATRNDIERQFAADNYWNAIGDLSVVLRKL